MNEFTKKRFLSDMSEEEFFQKLDEHLGIARRSVETNEDRLQHTIGRLVYGLRGIQDLFHCSHKTAQFYKDHVINQAVMQNGRKIIIDADLALRLFDERRSK